jgi:hypothetical protein
MPIEIIDDPVVRLTASDYAKWMDRYNQAFSMYCGTPPTFASWVHKQFNQHHYTREVLALMERLADFEDAASQADGEVK